MKNMKIIFLVLLYSFSSCQTYTSSTTNQFNPYEGMEIISFNNSHGYVFHNDNSNKLIIKIEGSGWGSVLGIRDEERWIQLHYGAHLIQSLGDRFTFLIPEKLGRQPGINYFNDMYEREHYTVENLLSNYIEIINWCIENNSFNSVILVGTSEGANLLPLIYNNMERKDIVEAIISISFGGLNIIESFQILSMRPELSIEWRAMYMILAEIFLPGKDEYPDTFNENVYGFTYRYYNSFKNIRPFDFYLNIDIPILFIHGLSDFNVPVESTLYIENHLPNKNFDFIYYDWGHQPNNYDDLNLFLNDITLWIDHILE